MGCGTRKRSKLRTHAGLGDERIPTTGSGKRTDVLICSQDGTDTIMASLDVKTAFDVAKPAVVSKVITLTGVHGHLTAALLAEMQDVRGSASFENSETEFRYSRCIRQGGVEAPVLWGRVANNVLWKAEEKWRARGWELPFGGQHDNEYVLRGMMWADNY